MKHYLKKGRLTAKQAADSAAELDPTDIVFRSLRDPKHFVDMHLTNGFMGIQKRGVLTVDNCHVKTCKNDLVQLLSGGSFFGYMRLIHDAAFTYGDDNHADVLHAFAKNQRWKDVDVFDGLYVGRAICQVIGENKNGFMFTERCEYKNIDLFENGLMYVTNNKQPYFLDMTNANDCSFGSPEFPLDPTMLSQKAMRFGGNKKGRPDSSRILIHSYDDLELDLDKSAKKALNWVRYDRNDTKKQRVRMFHGMGM